MRKLLLLLLCAMLLAGCRERETEYVSPNREDIREQFAPTERLPAPMPAEDDIPENTVVTPILPFE